MNVLPRVFVYVFQGIPTKNSLIIHQVKVDHGNRSPDPQQGQHDEPSEETAAGPRFRPLPILTC